MSRVIIYTLVGLAVLAFIIFFLPQIREGRKLQQSAKLMSTANIISDDEAYEDYVTRSESEVARFTKQIEQRKTKIANPTPAQVTILENLDTKFTDFSSTVSQLRGKTTKEERDQAVTHVNELKKEIRTMIRNLGGKTSDTEETK